MSVGEHTVQVFQDRSAADWSPPLADNAYFTDNADGWKAGPLQPALVWSAGSITPGSGSNLDLSRDETHPVPKPATDVETFRVRAVVTFTGGGPGTWIFGVWAGITPNDAYTGPFWQGAGEARELWSSRVTTAPGTYTIEATFTVPPGWLDGMGYVSPFIKVPRGTLGTVTGAAVSSLELAYRGGTSADLSCWVDAITIQHGRDDPESQPEPSAATLDITVDDWTGPLPAVVDIGAVVTITTETPEATSTRFTGRITDVALGWDDAGEGTPNRGIGQLVAVGMLADLSRRVIGDIPWPQELDGARVFRILEAADMPPDPTYSDPGAVQVLPRDVDSQPALDVAQATAQSADGTVWQTRDGEVRYADAEHRRGTTVGMDLDACDVLVTPTWSRTLEGLVNQISLGYGPTPEEGEQPRYLDEDPASVARFGRYNYTLATELATLADAQAMGRLLLARNASPVWVLSAIPIDVKGLTNSDTAQLLALDMHSLIRLNGLPAVGTTPTTVALWVEGWTEKLGWGIHELELNASGYCRSAPPPRWNDVSPATTWDTVDALHTWDGMACLGPPTDTGRWDDVPASTRWDQVPPGRTWDTVTRGSDF